MTETDTYVIRSLIQSFFPHAFQGIRSIKFNRAEIQFTDIGEFPFSKIEVIMQFCFIVIVLDLLACTVEITSAYTTTDPKTFFAPWREINVQHHGNGKIIYC